MNDVNRITIQTKSGREEHFSACTYGWDDGFLFIFYSTDAGNKEVWIPGDEIQRMEIKRHE